MHTDVGDIGDVGLFLLEMEYAVGKYYN